MFLAHAAFSMAAGPWTHGKDSRGEFIIGEELGKGGMSASYQIEYTSGPLEGRKFAAKFLNGNIPEIMREDIETFYRGSAFAKLQESKVVHPSFGLEKVDVWNETKVRRSASVIVSELADGDLTQFPLEKIKSGNLRALQFESEFERGMQSLIDFARTKTVHMDLKPANILARKKKIKRRHGRGGDSLWTSKTADYDVAKEFNEHLVTSTPSYAAPERLRYGAVGAAYPMEDWFSFGISMAERITGSTNRLLFRYLTRNFTYLEMNNEVVRIGRLREESEKLLRSFEEREKWRQHVRTQIDRGADRLFDTPFGKRLMERVKPVLFAFLEAHPIERWKSIYHEPGAIELVKALDGWSENGFTLVQFPDEATFWQTMAGDRDNAPNEVKLDLLLCKRAAYRVGAPRDSGLDGLIDPSSPK